jgi:hypothetical protein
MFHAIVMNLSEALKKSSAAAHLIYSYPVNYSLASSSSPLPGVGFGINEDRTDYRLVFHLASEEERTKVIEVCKELEINEPPYIQVVGPTILYNSVLGNRKDRPLLIGSYISRFNQPGGTLGSFVQKRKGSHDLFLLSCSHVLAPANIGNPGDPIFQPGGSTSSDDLVALLDYFMELVPQQATSLDAAIAKVTCPHTLTHLNVQNKSISTRKYYTRRKFEKRQKQGVVKVFKIGSASGETTGLVKNSVRVENSLGTRSLFKNLISIESEDRSKLFSHRGDSGSLIYDENGRAVGLLIGGTNPDSHIPLKDHITYALPIEPILNQLDVRLVLY